MHEAPGLMHKLKKVMHAYNPTLGEVEAEGADARSSTCCRECRGGSWLHVILSEKKCVGRVKEMAQEIKALRTLKSTEIGM